MTSRSCAPYYELVEAVAPGLVSRLVIVQTPSNGRHLYYRCPVIEGNQQLALNARRQTMIETRGEGGYALIPSSPATDLAGDPAPGTCLAWRGARRGNTTRPRCSLA